MFTSSVIDELNKLLLLEHKVSLVDKHESSGAESKIGQVQRYLSILCKSNHAARQWDRPEYYLSAEWALNEYCDYETGASPHEMHYGSAAHFYMDFPRPIVTAHDHSVYIQNLNDAIHIVRELSDSYHRELIEERKRNDKAIFNSYQVDDLVLFKLNPRMVQHKFQKGLRGPYKVLSVDRDAYRCEQVATKQIRILHGSRLTLYPGLNDAEAFEIASQDPVESKTLRILGYRGNPTYGRRYMTFLFEFADGTTDWVRYGPSIKDNVQFKQYIIDRHELRSLQLNSRDAGKQFAQLRNEDIIDFPNPFYLNLRCFSFKYYDELQLPDYETTDYVIYAELTDFCGQGNKLHTRANVHIPILNLTIQDLDKSWFHIWCHQTEVGTSKLITREKLREFPQIKRKLIPDNIDLDIRSDPAEAGTPAQRRGVYRDTSSSNSTRAPRAASVSQREKEGSEL